MTTLRQLVEEIDVIVQSAMRDVGQLRATYFVVTKYGEELVLPAPPLPKDQAVALVRAVLKSMRAVRVVFVDEAWCLRVPDEASSPEGSLEHVPGRREIIMYYAEDEDEGFLGAEREILRDGNSRPTLGPLVFQERTNMSGRMVGLLPTTGRAN